MAESWATLWDRLADSRQTLIDKYEGKRTTAGLLIILSVVVALALTGGLYVYGGLMIASTFKSLVLTDTAVALFGVAQGFRYFVSLQNEIDEHTEIRDGDRQRAKDARANGDNY